MKLVQTFLMGKGASSLTRTLATMRKLSVVFVFLAIVTVVHAHAAPEKLTKRQIASIKSQIQEAEEVSEYASVGSLKNDNGMYLTVYYETLADQLHNQREASDSYADISRCAVFGVQNNELTLFAKSGPLTEYSKNGKDFVNCAMAWGNVKIHHSNHGGGCSDTNAMWKFNLSDGQFILIGYDDIYSTCKQSDESEMVFEEIVTSINFLTNEARHWRKAGEIIEPYSEKDRWHRRVAIKKASKYKEVTVQFELDEPFVLELFDIEAFYAWMKRNKDLYGSIDEHYKYAPYK